MIRYKENVKKLTFWNASKVGKVIVTVIGEYSARKIYFFPSWRKNCEKISPYFHLQKWKIIQIALFLEIIAKISIFWGEIGKI